MNRYRLRAKQLRWKMEAVWTYLQQLIAMHFVCSLMGPDTKNLWRLKKAEMEGNNAILRARLLATTVGGLSLRVLCPALTKTVTTHSNTVTMLKLIRTKK